MKIMCRLIAFACLFLITVSVNSQVNSQKKYHLGAFVRLQGHEDYSVTLSQFQNMMNNPSEHSFSFKSFLKASSFGKLDYEFVSVKRNNSDTIPYYYDIMPPGYYSAFSSSNPNGYESESEGNSRVHKLTERYIEFLNNNLPDDVKLDGDGDGKVDILTYIAPSLLYPFSIKSYGGNWAGGIPHYDSKKLKIKGLNIGSFSVNIADSWNNVQANGIFKHEVGHNLRTWDYYDSNNTPGQRFRYRNLVSDPAGAWNMMTGASNTYGAYVIWSRLGFLSNEDVKVLHKSGTYKLNSLFSYSPDNVAFRVNSPYSDTEYFILEYRSRHKAFEWWHNSEGLVVSVVNPHVRGNPRGNDNPRAFELFYLRDKENNILFKNTSLNQSSSPRLALSDGSSAGFSLNNIRIEKNQLVFDLVFDDKPYIKAVEYPELVTKDAQTFEWKIETNHSNRKSWNAESHESWLTLTPDYKKGVLRAVVSQNTSPDQRNATIVLTAPGAKTRNAYLVQRGTSSKPALWLPELDKSNTFYIDGEENSYNVRVIGDLDGAWWGGNQYITNGRGERQVLHNSVNSIYAYRNGTDSDRATEIVFKLTDGQFKSFKVLQKPAKGNVPVYTSNVGLLPVPNDGKWYYIRTERGECTMSNFLKPIKTPNGYIAGTGFLAYNDSLLWTIESDSEGRAILRNKVLGYINPLNLKEGNVSFSVAKPDCKLYIKPNVSNKFYFGATGYVFEGNTENIKGFHMQLDGRLVVNKFEVNDFCTFFFEVPNAGFFKQQGYNLLNSLVGFEEFTETAELQKLNVTLNTLNDKMGEKTFSKNAALLVSTMNIIYNTIINKLSSNGDNQTEKWFTVKRYWNSTWGKTLKEQTDEYLYFANEQSTLNQDPLSGSDDRFGFKFIRQPDGTFKLINKAFASYAVSVTAGNICLTNGISTDFVLRPIITFRGLKFVLISNVDQKYLNYNSGTLKLRFTDRPALNNLVNDRSYLFEMKAL